jgi:hypothetical protein
MHDILDAVVGKCVVLTIDKNKSQAVTWDFIFNSLWHRFGSNKLLRILST